MSIKRKINQASVVSFDIFDTLLLRPYVYPTDLFRHIERAHKRPFFFSVRTSAEYTARQISRQEDITLDEIYAQVDAQFQDMKDVELAWEKMVLQQNPEMKAIWDYAKQSGKKIIVTSDMYLPSDFIADVLRKNGFDGWDRLYVSGEIKKTKATGTLFEHIIRDLDIPASKILHIGDNKKSDYINPRKYGIRAILYPQVVKNVLRHNPRLDFFLQSNKTSLDASILTAIIAQQQYNKRPHGSYWHKLGFEYAGPIIYGYTRHIEYKAQKSGLEHLMFVARDGYTLQRVFNTFNTDIENSYVYAPRFLNLICRLDYAYKDETQSKAIIDYFAQRNSKIKKLLDNVTLKDWSDYHNFIQSNIDLFIACADKERDNYKKYLLSHAPSTNRIVVVDTITARFSSQKLIQSTLGFPVSAMYWSVIRGPYEGAYTYSEYIPNTGEPTDAFTKNWNFMEFVMTAPEYPIKNITPDGKPVYAKSVNAAEIIRKQIYPDVSDGAVEFANYIKSLFGGNDIFLQGKTLVSYVNCLVDFPTNTDRKNMNCVQHAYDSAHSAYIPLFSVKIPLPMVILHPKRAIHIVRNTLWRSPLQTLALCLMYPLKIKTRGPRQIRILIWPKLQRRYFSLLLRFSYKCLYSVSVGQPEEIR